MGVLDDYEIRIARSVSRLQQIRDLEEQELERRDVLIVEAHDLAGMSVRKLAGLIDRSRARVHHILGGG